MVTTAPESIVKNAIELTRSLKTARSGSRTWYFLTEGTINLYRSAFNTVKLLRRLYRWGCTENTLQMFEADLPVRNSSHIPTRRLSFLRQAARCASKWPTIEIGWSASGHLRVLRSIDPTTPRSVPADAPTQANSHVRTFFNSQPKGPPKPAFTDLACENGACGSGVVVAKLPVPIELMDSSNELHISTRTPASAFYE